MPDGDIANPNTKLKIAERQIDNAVYFVVERMITGNEQAALYHDELPLRFRGVKAKTAGLIYAVRLDALPQGRQWRAKSVAQLYDAYRHARDTGKLPASA